MTRDIRHTVGVVLALLAVMAQLTTAAAVPPSTLSLADATVLCQHDGDTRAPAAPTHPPADCLLCFICHSALSPVGMVTAAPVVPPPSVVWIERSVVLPPATAPPPRISLAARPRGPPIPV